MSRRTDGVERTFYPNGEVEGEVPYVRGRVNGVTKRWHPNGVLASEIPVKNDMVEGVAKFWDESGELLGTYEIRNGTGIQKMWFPNGRLMGETPLLNGVITGRQIAFFENGDICAETYYIRNQKVSKKKYFEACEKDPSLPRYEGQGGSNLISRAKQKRLISLRQSAKEDTLAEQLLGGPGNREVLEWLGESSSTRTLGELPTREDSIDLANEVYGLGATKVTAVKIERYSDGQENTGKIVITLPSNSESRRRIFEWYAEQSQELGFDPEIDTGQKNLLLMLD